MNWYSKYKIAAPLPDIDNTYETKDEYGDIYEPNGIYNLNKELTEEHAKKLSKPGMKYLGAGWYGVAFNVNNIVEKYTFSEQEYKTANTIIIKQQGNQPLPGLVTVYATKNMTDEVIEYKKKKNPNFNPEIEHQAPMFVIAMEKVTVLDPKEKEIFKLIYRKSLLTGMLIKGESLINMPNEKIIEVLKGIFKNSANSIEQYKSFIIECINLFKTLREHNMQDTDIYYDNVGKRGNTIVVLDLGSIEFYRE